MIELGADIDGRDKSNRTALMRAAAGGDAGAASFLIEKGARHDLADSSGATALYLAARGGHPSLIALLADAKADTSKKNNEGLTPLHSALVGFLRSKKTKRLVPEIYRESALLLIQRGADVHARTNKDFTPLMFAIQVDLFDVVLALLKAGAKVDEAKRDGITPLMVAVWNRRPRIARLLLETGADPNYHHVGQNIGQSPLLLAAFRKNRGLVTLLHKAGAGRRISGAARQLLDRGNRLFRRAGNSNGIGKALEIYRKAQRLAPDYADLYFNIALAHELQRNFAVAQKNLRLYTMLKRDMPDRIQVGKRLSKYRKNLSRAKRRAKK